jgi:hypothetical protein
VGSVMNLSGQVRRTLRKMRAWLTRVIVAALVILGIVAAIEAVRSDSRAEPGSMRGDVRPAQPRSQTGSAVTDEPSPRCTAQQLALAIDVLAGDATIVLRHVWGSSCRLGRLPVELTVKDRAGRRVRLADTEPGVEGDFSPGFERLINITYLPRCGQRGPFDALVNVGPYTARRTLSGSEVGCFRGG